MTPQERRGWSGDILEVYSNIESWRDWHWRQYLSNLELFEETKNSIFLQYAKESQEHSQRYQRILDTMLDSSQAPEVPGFMQYTYGEYPEGKETK